MKSLGEVAVLSAVAMSKVTPPAPAGEERLTVKVKVVVPALPSFCETSLSERLIPGITVPVTEMSSTPTHSSLPTAFDVITRTCTSGWLSAAAGSVALTDVTSVAGWRSSRLRRIRRQRS